jgi:prophage regulatory protein
MNKFLRLPDVQAMFGLSRSSIYKSISEGLFPKPIPIGTRSVGWLAEEVETIFYARKNGRSNEEIRNSVKHFHSTSAKRSSSLNPNNYEKLVTNRNKYFYGKGVTR